jgi:lipase chaperone LimK
MLNMSKKRSVIIAITAIVIAAPIVFSMINSNDANSVKIGANNSAAELTKVEPQTLEEQTPTIATAWQWSLDNKNASKAITANNSNKTLPFTAKFVYEALKAVKLDEDGNVIHDHDALLSLDEALLRIQNKLDRESLNILQAIIKDGLPGKAGEQTAQIVGDYYNYLEAKDEFSRTSDIITESSGHETVNAVEKDQLLYAELKSLRDLHLGNEVSNGLFRITDSDAQYMFASMKLDVDESLSAEEKAQQRLEIEALHMQRSINITNWPDRYRAFQDTKQRIISASLNDEEKQRQITELLNSHFNANELKRIEHLGIDKL